MSHTPFIAPASCSQSPHIVARELGIPLELKILKFGGTKEGWAELSAINPLQQVPTLVAPGSFVLTEGPAILQYLCDQKPDQSLIPRQGQDRYRVLELLNLITSEIHKGFGPLFSPEEFVDSEAAFPELRKHAEANLRERFRVLDDRIARSGGPFLLGKSFCAADAYLFVTYNWKNFVKLDLAGLLNLEKHHQAVAARPAVREALVAEGLLKV